MSEAIRKVLGKDIQLKVGDEIMLREGNHPAFKGWALYPQFIIDISKSYKVVIANGDSENYYVAPYGDGSYQAFQIYKDDVIKLNGRKI